MCDRAQERAGAHSGVLAARMRKGLACFPAVPECFVAEPLRWFQFDCNTVMDTGASNLHFSLLPEDRWLEVGLCLSTSFPNCF